MTIHYRRRPLRRFASKMCDCCGRPGTFVSMATYLKGKEADWLDVCERCAGQLERD